MNTDFVVVCEFFKIINFKMLKKSGKLILKKEKIIILDNLSVIK